MLASRRVGSLRLARWRRNRARQESLLSISYPDSVQFLYALGNEFKTIKFGLERIRTLLAALGNPQPPAAPGAAITAAR